MEIWCPKLADLNHTRSFILLPETQILQDHLKNATKHHRNAVKQEEVTSRQGKNAGQVTVDRGPYST